MNEIQTYVQNQRAAGFADEQIKLSLINNGHAEDSLQQYFNVELGSVGADATSELKLYSYWNIAGGAVIGGPLTAVYMVQKNYEAWGEIEMAHKARKFGFLATVAVFVILDVIILFLPEDNDTRFGFVLSAIAFGLAQHYQGQRIKEHKENHGEFIGFWKSLGVALIGMLATLVLAAVTFLTVSVILSGLGLVSI